MQTFAAQTPHVRNQVAVHEEGGSQRGLDCFEANSTERFHARLHFGKIAAWQQMSRNIEGTGILDLQPEEALFEAAPSLAVRV